METIKVAGEPVLLDVLLVRRYAYEGQSLLTQTLELNPGIASAGAVIPIGTNITLPLGPDEQPFVEVRRISLFG